MSDLKNYFEELSFKNIKTYIQSGNILFQTKKTSEKFLENSISKKILEKYKFDVSTIVLKKDRLEKVISNNPFSPEKYDKVYVMFLVKDPSSKKIKELGQVDFSPEGYKVIGKEIYFHSPEGYSKGKLNNNFFEKKLDVVGTTRNWRSVNKLLEMFLD